MTILFLGTGDICAPTLRWLLEESGHRVVGVVCQPDRPVGRKQELHAPVTKTLAQAHGVPVFQPEKIKDIAPELTALHPDLSVVMAYGQFLPKAIREAARLGCINLHTSLLPAWRGAAPIQTALAAGDTETGVTVMHVDREMDAGDIILAERTPIYPHDTGQTLHDRLAELAPVALARALPLLEAGTAPRLPQDPSRATFCAKLTRASGRLDWSRPAVELERLIRALHPWPGTHTTLPSGKQLKIFPPAAVLSACPAEAPGTLLPSSHRDRLLVATGEGALAITEVQLEGGRRLAVKDFLAGHRLEPGTRLGHT